MAVARQWLSSDHVGIPTDAGKMFSTRPAPICYKQDRWSNELVMRQSPAGKKLSTEEEDIVGIRQQATTGEDTEDCAVVNCRVCELTIAL
jgi:hypothetical protein